MKTRLSALASAISSLSLLTACGGGGGSGPDSFEVPPLNPWVTIDAPTTANAAFAFDISWESDNTTSCTANFDNSTATDRTVSRIEAATGTYTYTVTCTGAAGTATKSVVVSVIPATAEGLWQGTLTSNGSTLDGVVTKEGDIWLPYTRSSSDSTIVGFYAGKANLTAMTATTGTFTSQNLRRINFDTGSVEQGKITSANYSAKTSLSGPFDPNSGGFASASGTAAATSQSPDLGGGLRLSNGSGTGTASLSSNGTLTVNWSGTTTVLSTNVMAVSFSDIFTGNISGGVFTATGGHTHINSCSPVSGNNFCADAMATIENTFATTNGNINIANSAAGSFIGTYTSAAGTVTNTYNITALSVLASGLSSITADTFTLGTYNNTYESTPALADIAGNYTAISTGINATNNPGATFSVSASGALTLGLDSASHCAFTATIETHASGNVYDVTAFTFTNSGGSCTYSGQTFEGVATYSANKLTITALNAARDKGLMIIATKP